MTKSSSMEPALVGSSVPNDCSAKRTNEWPSKHNQAGRGAKRQSCSSMLKVGCNDYSLNSSSPCIDGWNKSEYEAAGWPRWETTSKHSCEQYARFADTCEDDSNMACKRGWNESEDGNVKRAIGEGCDTIHHDGLDGWRQSGPSIHMVDKGSLSKLACWDRAADGNGKRKTGGWPKWPGATSKITRQCSSHQNIIGCWNQSEGWTTSEDGSTMACKKGCGDGKEKRATVDGGNAFDHDGRDGWRQPSSNIHIVDKGSLSKPLWDRAKDDNVDRENDGWLRWPGATAKTTWQCSSHQNRKGHWNQSEGWTTSEDGSTMACKRDWNESGDGKEKRVTVDGGDAFDHDEWRQSSSNIHIVDKGSLSKFAYWDRAKDDNVKRENNGWTRWPGTMSKTIRQFPSPQNRKVGWQSQGWTASDDSDSQKEPGGTNPDLVQNGDPWMQRSSVMSPKCDWNKSVSCTASMGDSLDRDQRKWDPGLDQTVGDPWKQISHTVPPKAGRRKFGRDTVAQCKNSVRRKSKWSGAPDLSHPDALNQHRSRWCAAMPDRSEQCPSSRNRKGGWTQSRGRIASEDGDSLKENNGRITDLEQSDDPWMHRRPTMSQKGNWNKSASWTESGGDGFDTDHRRWGPGLDQTGHDPRDQLSSPELPKFGWRKLDEGKNSFREKIKLSATPDFGAPDALKQNMHTFLPKVVGKKLFRGRSRIPYHSWEHGHYQSNDTYKKGAGGVSAYYRVSPSGGSQRDSQVRHQIDEAVRQNPDRDTEEFRDYKKARYLGHDRRTSFEDPWRQRDHLQDTVSWRHGSRNDGVDKNKLFRNNASCDGFLTERCSHHASFDDGGCPVKDDESKEICHDRRDTDSCFGRRIRGNGVPCEDYRELDVQLSEEFHSFRQFMLQNKSSDDKWDHKNTGKISSWNCPKVYKTIVRDSLSQSHLMRDDECFGDDTIKSMVTTPKQNVDQDVTNSSHVCQQSTQNLGSRTNDQTDYSTSSPIQFGQNMQVSPRLPSRSKSSNPNGQRQQLASNIKDEVQNHEQQAIFIRDSSTTQASTVCVSPSHPVFVQSPAIIGQKASINPEEIKTNSKKLAPVHITVGPSDKILNTSTHFVKKLPSEKHDFSRNSIETMNCPYGKSWNACHSEALEVQASRESSSRKYEKEEVGANGEVKAGIDKGIQMFKFALAEFVKEIIKPVWKEGRLSKEAHKTLVKKVVDKVVGVLGTNIPQTRERIDLYLSFAKDKLHKLVQDYLEMFINT